MAGPRSSGPARFGLGLAWLATSVLGAGGCQAGATPDIAGVWQTCDDATGRPAALVRISRERGVYAGRVEEVLDPDAPARCARCPGERRDQPLVGMAILTGLRRDGERYAGGEILDPEEGRLYRVEARLMEQGQRLEVRGYVGLPALGRSQIWLRQAGPAPVRLGQGARP